MIIKLIMVGKTSHDYLQKGIDDYVSRLKHYCKFEIMTIPDIKNVKNFDREQLKTKEAEQILKNIPVCADCILLDEKGKEYTSVNWAQHLEQKIAHQSKDIIFVIGGSMGFGKAVYDRADNLISLSKMTFSHQMVRLIFVEQLYRAFSIMAGEPYHHE